MKYDEAIDWLYGTQLFGIKLGLENVTRLLNALDVTTDLEGKKVVHVAGTNGKGSVCAFTEKILRDGGFRTGLFTSPHLVSFRERIRINGDPATEKEIAAILTRIQETAREWDPHPTFFEITFALAMRIFCDRQCERIVLETGMGGRLDATNSVPSDVAVITPISMDHQQWLGDTLEKIAAEKAGIMKPNTPVVIGDLAPAARDVIGRRALELGVPLIEAHPLPDDWKCGLHGQHQRDNAALAVEAACRVDDPFQSRLSREIIAEAISNTTWPGRFQIVQERLIIDGAHNVDAAEVLVETWREVFGEEEKANIIFGAASSKDVVGILSQLRKIAASFSFVPIKSERRISPSEMKAALIEAGGEGIPTTEIDTLATAIEAAEKNENRTLIAGSLFLAGEALHQITGEPFEVSLQ